MSAYDGSVRSLFHTETAPRDTDVNALTLVLALIAAWCLLSARLARWQLTAPIVFVAAGFALAQLGILDLEVEPRSRD